jgi:tRNA-uridine 2-sulfurtransferase
MIAVALSGGTDSAAAAVSLYEMGERITGMTMLLGDGLPDKDHLGHAAEVCRRLGIKHHIIDVRAQFDDIKNYFCRSYLSSETPNPCAVCNRDIKFGIMLKKALSLGAERIATGHYTGLHYENGRYFLAATSWKNSQEYFMGLVSQGSLSHAVFPLAGMGRPQAEQLVDRLGSEKGKRPSSQDVCFIKHGHVRFIGEQTGYIPGPGPITDIRGRRTGTHKGAINYTVGQRKGLVTAFGRRVFVLGVDIKTNTVIAGDRSDWPHRGFYLGSVNYQKIPGITGDLACTVKVRYRQAPVPSVVRPYHDGIFVDFGDLWSPGQLCVAYDESGAVLFAGVIEKTV